MNKKDAAITLQGYVLSEEGYERLEQIRDHLFMMASFVFVATTEEENTPLEINRSMLGQCFEGVGLQIDEVLNTVHWPRRSVPSPGRQH